MTNEAPGAFGYLWFQQKGTKGAVVVLMVVKPLMAWVSPEVVFS